MPNLTEQRDQFSTALGWCQLASPAGLRDDLLPFKRLENSAIVLTGPNSAGKTTIIKRLEERGGYDTVPEYLREAYEVGKGLFGSYAISRQSSDIVVETSLSRHICMLREMENDPGKPIICDRGLGDYIGFLQLIKCVTHPCFTKGPFSALVKDKDIKGVLKEDFDFDLIQKSCERQIQYAQEFGKKLRYKEILWLKPLPVYESDGLRSDDKMTVNALSFFVKNAWKQLGYKVRTIEPFFGDKEGRVENVLRNLDR